MAVHGTRPVPKWSAVITLQNRHGQTCESAILANEAEWDLMTEVTKIAVREAV